MHSRRGISKGVTALRLTLVVCVGIFLWLLSSAAPSEAAGTSFSGSTPDCSVTINVSGTTASAVIHSGCTGGNFYLESWTAQSDNPATSGPQKIFAFTNTQPFTVNLPPCFWQVDFVRRYVSPGTWNTSAAKGPEHIVGGLGGGACPTTTTSTSSTTVAPTTQPTIAGNKGTTTLAPTSSTAPAVATTNVAVAALTSNPATSGSLAFTGSDTALLSVVGGGALACGLALVGLSRRRRESETD